MSNTGQKKIFSLEIEGLEFFCGTNPALQKTTSLQNTADDSTCELVLFAKRLKYFHLPSAIQKLSYKFFFIGDWNGKDRTVC